MPITPNTPGIYVEETPELPPQVVQVATAVPAFIGYTGKDTYNSLSLANEPKLINSLEEYEEIFGLPQPAMLTINLNADSTLNGDVSVSAVKYHMYYALQLYFGNGGRPCYVNSIARYENTGDMNAGLKAIGELDEVTILILPDALLLPDAGAYYSLYQIALQQAGEKMDRIVLVDVYSVSGADSFAAKASEFRTGIGNNFLSYGAAYFPYLQTSLTQYIDEETQAVSGGTLPVGCVLRRNDNAGAAALATSLYHINNVLYSAIKKSAEKNTIILAPSAAIAGIYCQVDSSMGVWKAPAGINLKMVTAPMVYINDNDQEDMNVTDTGKSVNAIRAFTNRGTLVWGARTLAGNDNEWRYISTRRFVNMVQESVKKACLLFLTEPNNSSTWVKAKAMIDNFLILQWRSGALAGSKPEEAYFVNAGLGETMTALDILEGRMIIEIGMAILRPSEFIILRISQNMAEA